MVTPAFLTKAFLAWNCAAISGLPGSEDLAQNTRTGRIYVSSEDRRNAKGGSGALFALDPEPNARPVRLRGYDGALHPHGISIWYRDGYERLFVINHVTTKETRVEIFDVEGDEIFLVESVRSPHFVSPNDILATGPRSFILSSDHDTAEVWKKYWQDFTGARRGFLVERNVDGIRRVADGIGFPNGLALDRRTGELWVAATTEKALYAYRRDQHGEWKRRRRLEVPALPDNLEWDEAGDLLVGAHPSQQRFIAHAAFANVKSPSAIYRVNTDPAEPAIDLIFSDDGKKISGSSVGLINDDTLFIGSVFDPHVLRCVKR